MISRSFALGSALLAVGMVASIAAQQNPYLGRWNLTPTGDNTGVYWLEIKDEGGKLTGMFLNRGGHPLPLAKAHVSIELDEDLPGFQVTSEVRTKAVTGVEMEALTAVSVACLTLFDMLKAVDRTMTIGDIGVTAKTGGSSGNWVK